MQTKRVFFEEMLETFIAALLSTGIAGERAGKCARIIAESTFDGVESHGIRRVIPLIEAIHSGSVDGNAEPELMQAHGAIEIWDGHFGIGPLNASHAVDRAIELAEIHGVGCTGLRYTTHWLRAGSYGWQAVNRGAALICWTNTISNMQAWGAAEKTVGNNPMVIAVPHPERPIVLDMAMSQYALGTLSVAATQNKTLEVPAGYDSNGDLSTDPSVVIESGQILPAGFWKGSGLAIVLDALAVFLTGGNSTADFDRVGTERGVSQVFLAFAPEHSHGDEIYRALLGNITSTLSAATPRDSSKPVRYPGKGTTDRRRQNMELGVEVDVELWNRICSLVDNRTLAEE